MIQRNRKFTVRLTEEEFACLHETSEITGLKIEPLVRSLIKGCHIRPKPPESYIDLSMELSKISNHIYQLRHIAACTGCLSPEQTEQLSDLVQQTWRLVREQV